ncbi:MAG TPA: class I SAM-dependent methyltransferase [Vicinamibacterales bacterium]|nr:class I SAM-dependent methyltransferase [Vicinamibacterales bacterium]
MRALAAILTLAAVSAQSPTPTAQSQPPQPRHGRLFPPQDLGLLEQPDRTLWQKPDQIMDAVHVADGSTVADIGAGAGWFTIRLAQRVGPKGKVYAQDVQRLMLDAIKRRVQREGLENVATVQAHGNDPMLPARTLDAILMVDAYQEVENRVVYLRNLANALKPTGRIGIVNWKPGRGGPGPDPNERVAQSVVEGDAAAAGLQVIAHEDLPYQYLLVLSR